ncbi:MAG: permease [Desulfobacterales bacterium]
MKPFLPDDCRCHTAQASDRASVWLWIGLVSASAALWWLVYSHLLPGARFLTYRVLSLQEGAPLSSAIEFFLYDTPKVFMLLILVVFGVGIVRSFFSPERTRGLLAGKSLLAGNVLAALLGIVTPFCSCSAVPLFIGFVTAGVPLGVTFSFLISAPMVNEIALGLLVGLVGWKVALLYAGTGLVVAIGAGWVIGRLGMEAHVEGWVRTMTSGNGEDDAQLLWRDRLVFGWDAVVDILGRVWKFILLGIAIGALIHGFVPEGLMAAFMGKGAWWTVPLAVLLGVPMYSNAAGIIPVVEALMGKGAALGTVLAFMMSVIALSLPELIILRKVLKPKLIVAFVGVVSGGILMVGYLFNLVI